MPILKATSNFPILQIHQPSDWQDLLTALNGFLTQEDFESLRNYLSSSIKSVLIERDYIDKDYRDTYTGFYAKKFAQYPGRTIRLHFFTSELTEQDLFKLEEKQAAYAGYIVIRPTRVNSIGRSVLDPKKVTRLSGHLCVTEFKVHVLGSTLKVTGFPYISQDSDVTVCAHAATWMLFRYFSERYPNYAETYPYHIAQMTSDTSHGRIVPSKGLTVYQLSEMFSRFGFYPEIYFRNNMPPDDPTLFDRLLYYYIESGIPVVAGLLEKQHAITLFGHQSDFSMPQKKVGAMLSSEYVTAWIANDDNCLPYQILPRQKLPSATPNVSRHLMDDVTAFVVPLYEKIYLSAEHVDKLMFALLANSQYGIASHSKWLNLDDVVARMFLTSSKSYKSFRRRHPVPNGLTEVYLQLPMPKFIWVCEISTKDLYPCGKTLGEVIWDATANQNDSYPFLVIHNPGSIIVNDRDSMANGPSRFLLNLSLSTNDPYAIYRNNLQEC